MQSGRAFASLAPLSADILDIEWSAIIKGASEIAGKQAALDVVFQVFEGILLFMQSSAQQRPLHVAIVERQVI